ncbi:uncharacterized protein LOC105218575 [Zeugodacus cucurbitae]|uniref:uncharacterized protein LOC105218575 n=1 Tax=Zeugodacus cucurbitae TaxID=28588 RepID=UPI0005969023|nr:uncharacterized protein LOC105218575 [Zeugodacus cucurbitae]
MAEVSRKKRVNWSEAAEADLIQFWAMNMAELRTVKRNMHIHQEIAKDMTSIGHKYTAVEIRVKIKNFNKRYRMEKKNIGPSGISTWIHFDAVHKAITGYKSFCSDELAEDSIVEPIHVESESEGELPLPSPGGSSDTSNHTSSSEAEKKVVSVMDEMRKDPGGSSDTTNPPSSSEAEKTIVSVMDEMRKDFVKVFQAMNDADEKRLRILEKAVKDVSEMKDAFIEFLRRQN